MKYCRFVIMDTHSISPAVEEELKIISEPELSHRTIFIRREEMNQRILQKALEIEAALGRKCIFDIREVADLLARERDARMNGMPRSPFQSGLVRAKGPLVKSSKVQ